jgi:hypothetical protein
MEIHIAQRTCVGGVDCPMLKPALLYFAITFAAGFILGTIRTLIVAPRLGEVAAVLIECPFMLLASFLVARWVLEHCAHDANASRRLLIGLLAFAMLMCAELLMAWVFNRSPREYGASLLTTAGAIGLAAQSVFAIIPAFIRPRGLR